MDVKYLLIPLLMFLHSCSQEPPADVLDQESVVDEINLIDKEKMDVNSDDVVKMASRFAEFKSGSGLKSRVWSNVDVNVSEVKDPVSGKCLMYIVNRGDDEGYMVISATKAESPVLIYADSGSFDPDANPTTNCYFEQFKQQISSLSEDQIDSLRRVHAVEWAVFEKSEKSRQSRASNTEIENMINAQIAKKQAQGYTYIGKLSAASYYLNATDYQNLVLDISTHTNPDYDYEEVSLFFIKSYDIDKIGPLIGTVWHQGTPFNVDAPNGHAGCVPIAVAQILYYYQYPNKYDWSNISKYPSIYRTEAFDYFIKDVRNLCNVKYDSDGTGAYDKDAKKALESLGYVVSQAGTPELAKLESELVSRRPVYISGENANGKGHAWVCEGYQNVKYEGVVSMVIDKRYGVPDDPKSPYFDYNVKVYPPSSLDGNSFGEFFYMNMGRLLNSENCVNNGWYRYNSYDSSHPDKSYTKKQTMMIIKKN